MFANTSPARAVRDPCPAPRNPATDRLAFAAKSTQRRSSSKSATLVDRGRDIVQRHCASSPDRSGDAFLRMKRLAAACVVSIAAIFGASLAHAVDAVNVRLDAPAIDLTAAADRIHSEGERVQVSTAPGTDGIVRRIEVRSREASNSWAVFALANNSDEQIDRLIVVPHYRMVGSGLLWPDLGLSRVANITPSSGDRPDRQDS